MSGPGQGQPMGGGFGQPGGGYGPSTGGMQSMYPGQYGGGYGGGQYNPQRYQQSYGGGDGQQQQNYGQQQAPNWLRQMFSEPYNPAPQQTASTGSPPIAPQQTTGYPPQKQMWAGTGDASSGPELAPRFDGQTMSTGYPAQKPMYAGTGDASGGMEQKPLTMSGGMPPLAPPIAPVQLPPQAAAAPFAPQPPPQLSWAQRKAAEQQAMRQGRVPGKVGVPGRAAVPPPFETVPSTLDPRTMSFLLNWMGNGNDGGPVAQSNQYLNDYNFRYGQQAPGGPTNYLPPGFRFEPGQGIGGVR